MSWTSTIELRYRVYVRQHQDVELQIGEMGNVLQRLVHRLNQDAASKLELSFGEIVDDYWPVAPEALEGTRSKGYLITSLSGGRPCLVVRELPVKIMFSPDGWQFEDILTAIEKECPNAFAVIQILHDKFTDLQAV
jgi:hypothetical protein